MPKAKSITAPPEELASHFTRWSLSFKDYAEDLLMVQTIDGQILPLKFNNVQIALDEIINDIRQSGRLVRVIIDKLRRAGCSTYFAARNFWLTNMTPHTNALMITHEPEATDTIFGMHKRFYANLPKPLRPSVLYDNRKALVFNTKSRVGGLDSEIKCGTAGKENLGSSQLVNYAHWSEFSKWPESVVDALISSLMPTIPKTPESELVIESTANGIGNRYHSMYWAARYKYRMYLDANGKLAWKCEIDPHADAGNTWSSIFIPWFVFEKCQVSVLSWEKQTGQTFSRTAEEEEFVKLYLQGVPTAQVNQKLVWRRLTITDDFKGDTRRFNQEFPATDHESFISSGESAFDTHQLIKLVEMAPDPIARYEIDPETGQFVSSKTGRLWVWEERKRDVVYAIPADVSQGIVVNERDGDSKHDFSVCSVKEQLTGFEAAQWHGKIDPDQFGRLLYWLGMRYNTAWLIPENNKDGNTVIATLLRMGYKKLYVERVIEPPNPPRKRYGFSTVGGRDGGVRAEAINALVASMRDGKHGIRSKRTFEEMLAFKRNAKGKFEAESGRHDDCVTVEAIAKFAIPLLPLPAYSWHVPVAGSPLPRRDAPVATTISMEGFL